MTAEGGGPAEVAVRGPAARRQIEEWALVLAAAGVVHRAESVADGFELRVAARDEGYARLSLDAYDRERGERAAASPAAGAPEHGPSLAGVWLAAALLAFNRLGAMRAGWHAAGRADAGLILGGEPWRVVTALTLHAGPAHLLGNAVAAAVFVTALCRQLGAGLGLWVVLLGGAGGNLLNALVQPTGHVAVGASTGVFAALGALAGLAGLRRPRRLWVPLAAGLALLALLGTGEGSDLGAHLFGFLVGAALGVAAGRARATPPGRAVQAVLAAGAALAVAGCWLLALV